MKITKIGHCCLLVEAKGKRILIDPGIYTIKEHSKLEYVDYILFTHEHRDHFHIESLKDILKINREAKIYSNSSVNDILSKEGVKHTTIKNGELVFFGEVSIIGIGENHAVIHSSIPVSQNTGFFIDGRLWYPGDSFTNPERAVEVLALPVCGTWMKIAEAIDYALELNPKVVFPVHDGTRVDASHIWPKKILTANHVEFREIVEGGVLEI